MSAQIQIKLYTVTQDRSRTGWSVLLSLEIPIKLYIVTYDRPRIEWSELLSLETPIKLYIVTYDRNPCDAGARCRVSTDTLDIAVTLLQYLAPSSKDSPGSPIPLFTCLGKLLR
ncbi:hypothetical protein RRG08_055790 [Elysia crispata]|uniref:Uncharacterized protein n=1 Tax=Elysia crispata TaxID=231223 RepID=A0AAE1CL77_9GAST|nr:hypothetical protein RRG08_055790 [Elysia crispata]